MVGIFSYTYFSLTTSTAQWRVKSNGEMTNALRHEQAIKWALDLLIHSLEWIGWHGPSNESISSYELVQHFDAVSDELRRYSTAASDFLLENRFPRHISSSVFKACHPSTATGPHRLHNISYSCTSYRQSSAHKSHWHQVKLISKQINRCCHFDPFDVMAVWKRLRILFPKLLYKDEAQRKS